MELSPVGVLCFVIGFVTACAVLDIYDRRKGEDTLGYDDRILAIRRRWRTILVAQSDDPVVTEAKALLLHIAKLEAEVTGLKKQLQRLMSPPVGE